MSISKEAIRRHNEDILDEREEGDLLELPREGSVYRQWVKKDRFWDVVKDSRVTINNYRNWEEYGIEYEFTGEETARRAWAQLGEKGYNLFLNNFASWCRFGVGISKQADEHEVLSGAAKFVSNVKETASEIADSVGIQFD